jgi:2-polyprenyl-6-methoxyphenol hydroxylase-like FAD-dependent oxidoreductase
MTEQYDIVTIGGGLAGAALAKAMAENGYRVLVIERETQFKDRVRGEGMTPWGAAEVRELGILGTFLEAGAHEPPCWQTYITTAALPARPLAETTALGVTALNFYHPAAQEALLATAEKAGAEVRRGVRVAAVQPGPKPEVRVESDRGSETVRVRLVAAADGRRSVARKWGRFESRQDPPGNQVAGVLLENLPAPEDRVLLVINPFISQSSLIFPQGKGRGRAYMIGRHDSPGRFQGEKDFGRFKQASFETGMPADHLEGAKMAGPLATFDGAESWVDHPYRDGIALMGDAAATSDPSWGQGLSLAMRDVRVLRDALLGTDDWDEAGHAYAERHDDYYGKVRTCEQWFSTVFLEPGPEAEAVRARVLPQLAADHMYLPDTLIDGPDHAPPTEEHRTRILSEP